MKFIRNLLIIFFGILLFNGCTEEESFKELSDQVLVYPVIFDDNNIADRREPVFNESDEDVLTMRIAVHPVQSEPVTVTYEIRTPVDLDENTGVAEVDKDFSILNTSFQVTIPANRDFVDVEVLEIIDETDPESPEDFIFYLTDVSNENVKLREGSRQYRFTIRQSDDDIEFSQSEYFTFEGESDNVTISFSDALASQTRLVFSRSTTGIEDTDFTFTPSDTSFILPVGLTDTTFSYQILSDASIEYPESIEIELIRLDHDNGFLLLENTGGDIATAITIYDNSVNPNSGELAVTATWDNLDDVDLSLTLWENTGLDTVEISSVNSPTDFETIILDQTLFSGTYLVTASWESSTNGVVSADITAYVAENGPVQDLDNVNSTSIAEGEMVFLYEITKDGTSFINIDPQ